MSPPESPDLFATLFASSEDAIVVTTVEARIITWNPSATRLYGYGADEMVGKPLATLVPVDEAEELAETIGLLALGARVESFDARRVHRNGHVLDVSVTASPILDAHRELRGISWIERDVTGRRHVERMISHLAFHDPLTGLANRTLLRDRLQNSLERSRRGGGLVAVIYLDLDDFKQVNDCLGHPCGDRLLQLVATRLQSLLRPEDTLARLGGDEFVVVSDRVPSLDAAMAIAQRLERALTPTFEFDAAQVLVTASIGVAVGEAGADADRVLAHADRAMYSAKARGGAGIATFVAPFL
ncbi:MAG: diguanylate cyclase [Acidimicrobiia bacterium]|jgi:diguanylate cyclase (GGDEF)-like protein/PAS domain S-box-containing protein